MTNLHLVRLPIWSRHFTEWALDRGYLQTPPGDGRGRPRDADLGYALHASLCGLFGAQSPRPFAVPSVGMWKGRNGTTGSRAPGSAFDLLGYTCAPLEVLGTLGQLAHDDLQPLVDWDGAQSRPMPSRWPKDLRLGFDLRACPVRRIMRPFTTTGRPDLPATTFSKGSEVDAYQVAAVRARDGKAAIPERAQVYTEWLAERLGPQQGRPQAVSLVPGSVRVEAYRSVRLLRRPTRGSGRRTNKWLTRPEVRFSGLVDVVEPSAVPALLMRGIGRHCGFGFGMLLLRPA